MGVISIHAPVKGATSRKHRQRSSKKNFNPRTREGCDILLTQRMTQPLLISIHAPVKGATGLRLFHH